MYILRAAAPAAAAAAPHRRENDFYKNGLHLVGNQWFSFKSNTFVLSFSIRKSGPVEWWWVAFFPLTLIMYTLFNVPYAFSPSLLFAFR